MDYPAPVQRALDHVFGRVQPDEAASIHVSATITIVSDPLDEVDAVVDALDGRPGRRMPTTWMQEIAGQQAHHAWDKGPDDEPLFRGRACCGDVLQRTEKAFRRGWVRPPVEITCPECEAVYLLAMKAVR